MTATSVQTSSVPARRGTDHLIQLDGLRAVAIALVLAQHLLPLHRLLPNPDRLPPHKLVPPLGFYGVCLFFVLSGFLITRILLACRERVTLGESGTARQLGAFYARRTLRIFPLYYGTLLVLALLDVRHIRERLPWHLTYTENWLFSTGAYNAGGFDRHLWSLAVEEQFYLVWPWVILLSPRKLLLPLMALAFACGPLWRAWFALRGWPWQWAQFPTPANLDLLAMGGIVALAWPHLRARRWLAWSCLVVGLPAALFTVVLFRSDFLLTTRQILQPTALALCFAAFVGFCGQGVPVAGKLLELRPVLYVGKVSYAMYVFHNFAPPVLRWAVGDRLGASQTWGFGVASVALTLAAAALSWHLFEAPINRLKRLVPYATPLSRERSERNRPSPDALAPLAPLAPQRDDLSPQPLHGTARKD